MCVKLPLGNLNSDPCPLHPTSTYIFRMTTTLRVRGGQPLIKLITEE